MRSEAADFLKKLFCEFDFTTKAEFTDSCPEATCPLSNFIRRIASFLPAPLTCNISDSCSGTLLEVSNLKNSADHLDILDILDYNRLIKEVIPWV